MGFLGKIFKTTSNCAPFKSNRSPPTKDDKLSKSNKNEPRTKSMKNETKDSKLSRQSEGTIGSSDLDLSTLSSVSSSLNCTPLTTIVQEFIERINAQDRQAIRTMVTPDLKMCWEDQEMMFADYIEAVESVWKSFPDFHLSWQSIQESTDKKGKVVVTVKDCIPRGTHTGEPFGFGPYEPIEAQGTKIENAAETITVHLTPDGKICQWLVNVNGEMTGPAGMYTQLGGFPCM